MSFLTAAGNPQPTGPFQSKLLIISSIYWWGPSLDRKWHFFSKGAFLATVLCIAISLGFSAYINNFNSYNKLYGSLGTLIGFMIWLQAMSFTVLLGFEINAGIDLLIRAKKRERLKSKSSE
jgi:membrane protein